MESGMSMASAVATILAAACAAPPVAQSVAQPDAQPGSRYRTRLEIASRSEEAWRARSAVVRRQILVASGLWPEPERPPVRAEVSGRVDRDGYSVERVAIETLPGFTLPATLYRPLDRGVRHPAVVSPHGHWSDGRFTDHGECSVPGRSINLARLGIAVLAYDMVGFGDLKELGHDFGDPAWGISLQGLQLWNSLRAVDFLESLPDVDPRRIGATGASGGGTQTFLLAALDPRIAVSAPVNMVADGFQGGCLCENAPLLRLDLNNVEIAAAVAPRPLLLIACTGDWTVDVPTATAPVVQRVYDALGAPERFRCRQIDAGHNYNQDTREIVYAWLARWLLDAPDAERIEETPFTAEPRPATSVAVANDLAAVAESLRERARARLEAERPRDRASLERYRDLYGPAWLHALGAIVPEPGEIEWGRDGERMSAALPPLSAVELRPLAGGPASRIWVAASAAEAARAPAGRGYLLELRPHEPEPACNADVAVRDEGWRAPVRQFKTTYHRTELARRVQDVLVALAAAPGAELAGVGEGAAIALLARAIVPGPATLDLEGVDETRLASEQPGFLALGGLRGAALLNAGRPTSLAHPGFEVAALEEAWTAARALAELRLPR